MRKKKELKPMVVTLEVYKRLKEDCKHFQETIGGGIWSLSDTITEYLKIMNR